MTLQSNLLADKVVVIIGGAGLIGQAFVQGLIQHAATVVMADIDMQRCQEVCTRLEQTVPGCVLHPESVDIIAKASLQGLIQRVLLRFGKIDAVVNNAYPRNKQYGRRLEQVEFADFCENMNLHLGGYFLSSQQFSAHFAAQGFGHVINISSIYGMVPPRFEIYNGTSMTMPVEYAAIKAAILHLSLYFMRYYKGTAVRFNCISPGGIFDAQPAAFVELYKQYSQHKGMLVPSDLAGTLVYLVSDLSSYVNGQNIVVDDGWSA
jgi:NAD(P)-dependent dehydrogenase (short-subunit alcohol dehydrogenase family)